VEKRTRYNELLGIPNTIRDPDLYQLLGLERATLDAAVVEERYRERMGTLQAIKSPKHKSFIEFLKGELRRARAVLVDDRQRAAYDLELLEERRGQLTRILDIVLADGTLRPAEEERIQALAAEVGLSPAETEQVLQEELAARGARRASEVAPIDPPPAAAPAAWASSAPAPSPAPTRPATPPARAASASDILRAIERSMPTPPPPARRSPPPAPVRPPARAPAPPVGHRPSSRVPPPPPPEEEEEVVAELVEEAPPQPAPRFQPSTPGTGGWGKAAVVRVTGVCSSCLSEVFDADVAARRAERLDDGRLHCPACFNRLVAGLNCGACYQRITRSDMKSGRLRTIAGRVFHGHCIGR
jgi:hypothetical protein